MPDISFVIFPTKNPTQSDAIFVRLNKPRLGLLNVQDGRVKALQELRDARSAITSVLNPPGAPPPEAEKEQIVWRAYLNLEKNVALLKLELAVEKPGEFVNDELKSEDTEQYLRDSLSDLDAGIVLVEADNSAGAWPRLRLARNYLRFYLRHTRKSRLKAARTKKASGN